MNTETVLLIFDDMQEMEIYGTMLRGLGYKAVMCGSLAEGINSLDTEDVSMVIVSQGTHAFEGRQALERALQLRPKVPVVVVARVLDMKCYLEAMDMGAVDYLERPEPGDMAWIVDTQMRQARRVDLSARVTDPVLGDLVPKVTARNPQAAGGLGLRAAGGFQGS